jgi:hypothetical protein
VLLVALHASCVAISNRRLIAVDQDGVTFRCKDYRIDGHDRYKTMTFDTNEFIRRFLMHVRRASTASGITGFSPTPAAPPISPRRASCSPRRSG